MLASDYAATASLVSVVAWLHVMHTSLPPVWLGLACGVINTVELAVMLCTVTHPVWWIGACGWGALTYDISTFHPCKSVSFGQTVCVCVYSVFLHSFASDRAGVVLRLPQLYM